MCISYWDNRWMCHCLVLFFVLCCVTVTVVWFLFAWSDSIFRRMSCALSVQGQSFAMLNMRAEVTVYSRVSVSWVQNRFLRVSEFLLDLVSVSEWTDWVWSRDPASTAVTWWQRTWSSYCLVLHCWGQPENPSFLKQRQSFENCSKLLVKQPKENHSVSLLKRNVASPLKTNQQINPKIKKEKKNDGNLFWFSVGFFFIIFSPLYKMWLWSWAPSTPKVLVQSWSWYSWVLIMYWSLLAMVSEISVANMGLVESVGRDALSSPGRQEAIPHPHPPPLHVSC